MERIDLFDRYVMGKLSKEAKAEFDARLESDEDFAADFKVYLLTVQGIRKETAQDNMEFGIAMKKLSKEQLREVIGKKAEAPVMMKPQTIRFKPWIWQAASIAAVIVIAFTVVFNIEKNARIAVDNAMYACAEINIVSYRSGGEHIVEPIDIKSMSDEELEAKLPELINLYRSASDTIDVADNGYALAMAYVRLHDRDNAKIILGELIARFNGNPDCSESVNKWESIMTLLK